MVIVGVEPDRHSVSVGQGDMGYLHTSQHIRMNIRDKEFD
jgi:hypothetical protein